MYFDNVDVSKLEGKIVADFGSGIGRWSYILSKRVNLKSLVVSDASDAIFVSRENLKEFNNVIFLKFDIDQCPFDKNVIDFGFCLGVLHHLPYDLNDSKKCINKIHNSCKENLFYLYWKFDERGIFFKSLYKISNLLRLQTIKFKNYYTRKIISHFLTLFIYFPFIFLNRFFYTLKIPIKKMPLTFYTFMSYSRVRQDAYDKFFTSVEYRYSKNELKRIFYQKYKTLIFSEKIPKWTFMAIKDKPLFLKYKKKKILLITQGVNDGGAQKIIGELATEQDKNLNIKYLCIGDKPKNFNKFKNIIFTNNNRMRGSFYKCLSVINEFRPDVVMSTLTSVDLFVYALQICSKKKFKHIIRLSVVITSHYSQYYYFPITNFVLKLLFANAEKLVCMSDDMISDLKKNYQINSQKIEKIPNFIKINKSEIKTINKQEKKIKFICVGRIHHQKGYDILIEAIKFTNKKFKIDIYGWGDKNLLNKYAELINKNNFRDCINFKGRRDIHPRIIRKYDALILPSRYEGFPNVAIEAMSVGIPVLALPFKGGINEIIKTGRNGTLAKGMHPKDLAKIISNFDKRIYKSSAIIKSISLFEKNKVLKKYFQLLKDV